MTGAPQADGLSSASPIEPVPVSPVPASIPSADKPTGQPDCKFCRGWGFYRVVASGTLAQGDKVLCGNCAEAQFWQGLEREPQRAWCVWTKAGRSPSYWHNRRDAAETEAARLARKYPGKTFIVFEKLVNVRTAQAIEARSATTAGRGPKDESAVAKPCAPTSPPSTPSPDPTPLGDRTNVG